MRARGCFPFPFFFFLSAGLTKDRGMMAGGASCPLSFLRRSSPGAWQVLLGQRDETFLSFFFSSFFLGEQELKEVSRAPFILTSSAVSVFFVVAVDERIGADPFFLPFFFPLFFFPLPPTQRGRGDGHVAGLCPSSRGPLHSSLATNLGGEKAVDVDLPFSFFFPPLLAGVGDRPGSFFSPSSLGAFHSSFTYVVRAGGVSPSLFPPRPARKEGDRGYFLPSLWPALTTDGRRLFSFPFLPPPATPEDHRDRLRHEALFPPFRQHYPIFSSLGRVENELGKAAPLSSFPPSP